MSTSAPSEEVTLLAHIKRSLANFLATTMACGANAKEQALIKKLEFDVAARKKKFGVDYLTAKESAGIFSPEQLQALVDQATTDIEAIKKQIRDKELAIEGNKEELQRKIKTNAVPAVTAVGAPMAASPIAASPIAAAPIAASPIAAAPEAAAPVSAAPVPVSDPTPAEPAVVAPVTPS
jgi:hypothetical protein